MNSMTRTRPPKSVKEVIDILIGEMAHTRRKFESLVEVLEEKGVLSAEELKNKLKEKTEEDKLDILIESIPKSEK